MNFSLYQCEFWLSLQGNADQNSRTQNTSKQLIHKMVGGRYWHNLNFEVRLEGNTSITTLVACDLVLVSI